MRRSLSTRPLGLAVRAVVDRVLLEVDPRERRAAVRARLAEPVVDAVDGRVRRALRAAARGRARARCGSRPARRSISSSSSWVESAYGESRADVEDLVRPRAADAGDQRAGRAAASAAAASRRRGSAPASRRRACRPRGRGARAPPRARRAAAARRPRASSRPPSVRTSSPPSAKRSRNIRRLRPLLARARCTGSGRRSSGAPSARARRRRSGRAAASPAGARPRTPRPRARTSGGSNVFSVAMCAGPAFAIGLRLTSGSSRRRQASTSGSSGIGQLMTLGLEARPRRRCRESERLVRLRELRRRLPELGRRPARGTPCAFAAPCSSSPRRSPWRSRWRRSGRGCRRR